MKIDIFIYYLLSKLLPTYYQLVNQIMQKFMKQSRNTYHVNAKHKEM